MSRAFDDTPLPDQADDYLISVSDVMAGLLFVFIITLMAFVLNLQEAEEKARIEQERLTDRVNQLEGNNSIRNTMLGEIRGALANEGIPVQVDTQNGVLRLEEQAVRFESGSAGLQVSEAEKVRSIGLVLARILPCYTVWGTPGQYSGCDERTRATLEAVFLEGHTDNVPLQAGNLRYPSNWELSASRAITAYRLMIEAAPMLEELHNPSDEPIFSVSGYGEQRPLIRHSDPTSDPTNRRIDLRFIMVPPDPTSPGIVDALESRGVR